MEADCLKCVISLHIQGLQHAPAYLAVPLPFRSQLSLIAEMVCGWNQRCFVWEKEGSGSETYSTRAGNRWCIHHDMDLEMMAVTLTLNEPLARTLFRRTEFWPLKLFHFVYGSKNRATIWMQHPPRLSHQPRCPSMCPHRFILPELPLRRAESGLGELSALVCLAIGSAEHVQPGIGD